MLKKEMKDLAVKLKLEPTARVLEEIHSEFSSIQKDVDHLLSLNVDGVEPMYRIASKPITFLREDKIQEVIDKTEIIKNAFGENKDFITVKKVVDHD